MIAHNSGQERALQRVPTYECTSPFSFRSDASGSGGEQRNKPVTRSSQFQILREVCSLKKVEAGLRRQSAGGFYRQERADMPAPYKSFDVLFVPLRYRPMKRFFPMAIPAKPTRVGLVEPLHTVPASMQSEAKWRG